MARPRMRPKSSSIPAMNSVAPIPNTNMTATKPVERDETKAMGTDGDAKQHFEHHDRYPESKRNLGQEWAPRPPRRGAEKTGWPVRTDASLAGAVRRGRLSNRRSQTTVRRDARQARALVPQSRLATVQHPGTDPERRVKDRKRPQRVRKDTGHHKWHQHCGNEHYTVEHGSRAELSSAGPTTESIGPPNDGNGHSKNTEQRTLVSGERRIHEDRLHRTRPDNEQRSERQRSGSIHSSPSISMQWIGWLVSREDR